jgi:hypothetical protein
MLKVKKYKSDEIIEVLVDPDQLPLINHLTWMETDHGYVLNSQREYLHRVITQARCGQVVDHRNGNKLDNRRENLRVIDRARNVLNRRAKAGRKYKGTRFHSDRNQWSARISYQKKTYYLGYFSTEESAACAYNQAARELHKEFARLNDV